MQEQIFRCKKCGFLIRVLYRAKPTPPKKCYRCNKKGVFEPVVSEGGKDEDK